MFRERKKWDPIFSIFIVERAAGMSQPSLPILRAKCAAATEYGDLKHGFSDRRRRVAANLGALAEEIRR